MRTSFSVNDMTIHRIVEQESGFTPMLDFLPTLSKETLEREPGPGWRPAAMTARAGMSCCASSPMSSRRRTTTSWSIACIGNDKNFPLRPTWNKKTDGNWMGALKAAGLGVEDIDFVMCTHLHGDHVGWNTRLENGRWVPTFPKARYLFSKKEYDYWSEIHREDAARPDHRQRAADHRGQPGRTGHQRPCAQRPYPVEPDPGPHARPFRGLRRQGRRPAVFTGDLIHSPIQARYPELVMRVDTDRDQAVADAAAVSSSATATPTRCAARCTSRRPRSATSSAGATASAWNTQKAEGAEPPCLHGGRAVTKVYCRDVSD